MAVAQPHLHHSPDQHGEQAEDEQVRWQHIDQSVFAYAAQADQREQQKNEQADRERMRDKRWNGRDERADAGGDTHTDVEQVVEHERRSREQADTLAEVLAGDGVRAAALRIGCDGLPVGKVDDQQQQDDRDADRHHIADTERRRRDEDGERGFRTVSGRTQGVEAKCGHAREHTNALLAVFFRGEGLA